MRLERDRVRSDHDGQWSTGRVEIAPGGVDPGNAGAETDGVDQPDRVAAAISGPVVMHEYLLADPVNSTVTELALWSDGPVQTAWPAVTDTAVLDALAAPLCTAYLDSCP